MPHSNCGIHFAALVIVFGGCSNQQSSASPDENCCDGGVDTADGTDELDFCGDGILNENEQCDDGNTNNDDGCSADCEIEDGFQCPTPGEPRLPIDECVESEYIPQTPIEWLRAQQARFSAKALVTSIGEGVSAANLHSPFDSNPPWQNKLAYMGGGTFGWCGFIDLTFWGKPSTPRPVYFTVMELMKYIRAYDKVTCHSVDFPNKTTIHRYDFVKNNTDHSISVVWYDDRIGQLPGDDMPSVSYEFVKPGFTTIEQMDMIVGPGQTEFKPHTVVAKDDGVFDVTITETPSLLVVNHVSDVEGEIDFILGMEYTVPCRTTNQKGENLADVFKTMGATLTKPKDGSTNMVSILPNCSTRKFDFVSMDEKVSDWQAAGYEFLIALSMSWENKKPSEFTPDEEDCYRDYLRTFVERYDGDGQDDMPGLLEPIRYWQIESEFRTGFFDIGAGLDEWENPGEEYLVLLEIANEVIKGEGGAYPEAIILTIPGQFRGIFSGYESENRKYGNYIDWDLPTGARKTLDNVKIFMSRPDLFDVVSYNNIADWSHSIGAARFLRGVMDEYGYSKPIFMSDMSYTVDPMLCIGMCLYPYDGISVNPFGSGQYNDVVAFLDSLGPNEPFEDAGVAESCEE